jgi:hypothetical protein
MSPRSSWYQTNPQPLINMSFLKTLLEASSNLKPHYRVADQAEIVQANLDDGSADDVKADKDELAFYKKVDSVLGFKLAFVNENSAAVMRTVNKLIGEKTREHVTEKELLEKGFELKASVKIRTKNPSDSYVSKLFWKESLSLGFIDQGDFISGWVVKA